MKANHKSDLEEMSTLSVINLLPSNEAELASFKAKLRKEILVAPDCLDVLKQLHWCLRSIGECIEDPDIKRRFYLESLTFGSCFFNHKGMNVFVNPDTDQIIVEL